MFPPDINQDPDMRSSQPPEYQGQQTPEEFRQETQYYPLMTPYDTEEEPVFAGIGPQTVPGDPPPILSNNPASTSVIVFKELTGYANYGNPSRNADILYTGNRGTWTFNIPAFLLVPGNLRAQIRIRAVLDDHASVPTSRYSARITVNGNVVQNGRVNLAHGTPSGGMFTNWTDLTYNITNVRRNTQVTIENTSTAGNDNWIGLDWMEIRFIPR